jgi:ACS family hexuronate transporter-like MFS transporter
MRTFGNSILQSGASVGAVLTPMLVLALERWNPDSWRWAFLIVGGFGLPWAVAWLLLVRERDVRRPVIQTDETSTGPGGERELQEIPFWQVFTTRRWWLLLAVVCLINTVWHFIRVWMPVWLEKDLNYSHEFVQKFTSAYFLATFFGALASGWLTSALPRRGWNVHRARLAVFLVFALMSGLVVPAAYMKPGPLLLGTLLVVAFGTLGLFPIYYSLNQEISAKNQGKVGGSLGFATWGSLYFFHGWVGALTTDNPGLRPLIFTVVGCGPLLAFFVLLLFWGRRPTPIDSP